MILVGVVNDYALNKLETLEEKYPVIVKPTEEMVGEVFVCNYRIIALFILSTPTEDVSIVPSSEMKPSISPLAL